MGLLDNQTQQQYQDSSNLGGYQFTSLDNIIDQFLIAYVGQDKLIDRIKRVDVQFHAQRSLQELSFDTFKSTKAQEIVLPTSLKMILPQDYVNYVKISYCDSAGIEHNLYPALKTSNPNSIVQGTDGSYTLSNNELQYNADSKTWDKYKGNTENENNRDNSNYNDDAFDYNEGVRYGLDPQHAQVNGSFYIDENKGNVHFSSNLSVPKLSLIYFKVTVL